MPSFSGSIFPTLSIFLLYPPSLLQERSSIFPPPPTIPFNHLCFPPPALNLFCPLMYGLKKERRHLRLTSPCHLCPLSPGLQLLQNQVSGGKGLLFLTLLTLLIVMCRDLFQLLFGQSIPLEPFPMLDATNYLVKGSGCISLRRNLDNPVQTIPVLQPQSQSGFKGLDSSHLGP